MADSCGSISTKATTRSVGAMARGQVWSSLVGRCFYH